MINYCKCEYCGERFTEANPNMGSNWRDYHGSCREEAILEGTDVSDHGHYEPYQIGQELEGE